MNKTESILTLSEAASLWGITPSTLRMAILNKRLTGTQIKKSAGTWLIHKNAMEKLYGERDPLYDLFTIGYEGKTINEFINILTSNKINVIFDVRRNPISRKKGFSMKKLSETLGENGIDYYGFKELGSPKGAREALHATNDYILFFKDYKLYLKENKDILDNTIKTIKQNINKNICLMCFEKDSSLCHRSVLAKELLKKDRNINRINNI